MRISALLHAVVRRARRQHQFRSPDNRSIYDMHAPDALSLARTETELEYTLFTNRLRAAEHNAANRAGIQIIRVLACSRMRRAGALLEALSFDERERFDTTLRACGCGHDGSHSQDAMSLVVNISTLLGELLFRIRRIPCCYHWFETGGVGRAEATMRCEWYCYHERSD